MGYSCFSIICNSVTITVTTILFKYRTTSCYSCVKYAVSDRNLMAKLLSFILFHWTSGLTAGQPVDWKSWNSDAHSLRLYLQLLCAVEGKETLHSFPTELSHVPLSLPASSEYVLQPVYQVSVARSVPTVL